MSVFEPPPRWRLLRDQKESDSLPFLLSSASLFPVYLSLPGTASSAVTPLLPRSRMGFFANHCGFKASSGHMSLPLCPASLSYFICREVRPSCIPSHPVGAVGQWRQVPLPSRGSGSHPSKLTLQETVGVAKGQGRKMSTSSILQGRHPRMRGHLRQLHGVKEPRGVPC